MYIGLRAGVRQALTASARRIGDLNDGGLPRSGPSASRRALRRRLPLAETINGLYKAEVIHRLPPGPYAAAWATLNWVGWFNNPQLLEPISNMPPAEAEAEANYSSQIAESAVSVGLKPTSLREAPI